MENSFALVTDSSCDLPDSYLDQTDIIILHLSFFMDDKPYTSKEMGPKEFFQKMREGHMPTTTQVNVEQFTTCFEPLLQEGKDILYLAFSSGLSGTCESGQTAAAQLREKYPQRKIIVVDTLCASLGQGLYVHLANEMRKEGKSIDEVAQWAQTHIQNMTHQVTVDDLMHLHRGGRVSKASAVVGSLLGIKPMIIMDSQGKLTVVDKVRGRKQSLAAMVDMAEKCGVENWDNKVCYICHGDCEEDAKYVAELVKKRFGVKEFLIYYVGPVIGCHTGPGVVALFLMGDKREFK